MILCYLIKIDVGETKGKCLSSTIPHISKNDRLFCCSQWLKSIVNNRIDANLMIKHCFQILTPAFSKYWFKHLYRNLFFTFRARKPPRKGTENAYTICWFRCTAIVHLGQGSGKEHAIKEEHILHAVLQAQIFAYNRQKVQAILNQR